GLPLAEDLVADEAVEALGEAVQARARAGGVEDRRLVALAGREGDLAGQEELAGLQLDAAVLQPLDQQARVAAPGEVGAEDIAMVLAEAALADHEVWRRVVRGAAGAVLLDQQAGVHPLAHGAELLGPAAVEQQRLVV